MPLRGSSVSPDDGVGPPARGSRSVTDGSSVVEDMPVAGRRAESERGRAPPQTAQIGPERDFAVDAGIQLDITGHPVNVLLARD